MLSITKTVLTLTAKVSEDIGKANEFREETSTEMYIQNAKKYSALPVTYIKPLASVNIKPHPQSGRL